MWEGAVELIASIFFFANGLQFRKKDVEIIGAATIDQDSRSVWLGVKIILGLIFMGVLSFGRPSPFQTEKQRARFANALIEIDRFRSANRPTAFGRQRVKWISPWVISNRRRILDCLVAIFALLVIAPLLLVIAVLVKIDSPGPILFRQRRMGRNGQEFTLFKFRSMESTSCAWSPITVSGDSRITSVGAFLRRFKLDELPQFWNVLKGDMSLVGPRPKLPHHEALYMNFRPGITGPATLAFRNEEEFLASIPKHELDLFYQEVIKPSKAWIDTEYMRKATFFTDMKLLWITGASCLGIGKYSIEDWAAYYHHNSTRSALADGGISA